MSTVLAAGLIGPFRAVAPPSRWAFCRLSAHVCDRKTVGPVVDPETGFQYLQARYYDAATGQFVTVDPIQAVTRAPYAYGNDNPLNYTDPSGLGGVGPAKTGPAPGEGGNTGTAGATAAGGGSPKPPGGSGPVTAAQPSNPENEPCQVSYGDSDLSRAVQEARLKDKEKGHNYAAARLANGTIIVGVSREGVHAEEDVITQAGDQTIVELYSEREPCSRKCLGLTAGMRVTYTWPWNGVERDPVKAAIKNAICVLFGG